MTIQIILGLVGLACFIYSQENGKRQKVLARFIVTEAWINGVNLSDVYVANKAYFAFYKTGSEPIAMGGVLNDTEHQTFGHVSYIAAKRLKQTSSIEPTDKQSFIWTYENNFDGGHNTANVELTKQYTPNKIEFELLIETQDHNRLLFKGYMGDTTRVLK
jgi:hypothetical protein